MKNSLTDIKGTGKRLGIFGGTFNPIHYGHLRAAEEAGHLLGLERIIFIPSGNPPLKGGTVAPAQDRHEMTSMAIKANPLFVISDVECRRRGRSYTVETIAALKEIYRDEEFHLILGIDSFLEMPAWRQPEKIQELVNFVVISRPGYAFSSLCSGAAADAVTLRRLDENKLQAHRAVGKGGAGLFFANVTRMDISATGIRKLIRDGMSIKYLLPETVESYIIQNKLYLEGS